MAGRSAAIDRRRQDLLAREMRTVQQAQDAARRLTTLVVSCVVHTVSCPVLLPRSLDLALRQPHDTWVRAGLRQTISSSCVCFQEHNMRSATLWCTGSARLR